MPKVRLSAQGLPHLKPGEHWDELVGGLHVRVSKTGRRTFALRYRVHGSQRRQKLGVYDSERYTLANARNDAKGMLEDAADGRDPRQPALDAAALSFAAEAQRVLDNRAAEKGLRPATCRERQRILDNILIPVWGERPVGEIRRRDMKDLRATLVKTPVQANRVVRLVSLIFNELLDDELVDTNPAHRIDALPEPKRRRPLSQDEIGKLWTALDNESMVMAGVLRVTLLTAQRVGSVRQMRWDQIAEQTWRIPAAAFKGGREHWVPLSKAVQDVLDELRPLGGRWVFPALRSDTSVGHIQKTDSAVRRIAAKAKLAPFRAHDFRATFRTHVTRPTESTDQAIPPGCGVDPVVADSVLGHLEDTVALRHYHGRPEEHRLAEKREALERWGEFVGPG